MGSSSVIFASIGSMGGSIEKCVMVLPYTIPRRFYNRGHRRFGRSDAEGLHEARQHAHDCLVRRSVLDIDAHANIARGGRTLQEGRPALRVGPERLRAEPVHAAERPV